MSSSTTPRLSWWRRLLPWRRSNSGQAATTSPPPAAPRRATSIGSGPSSTVRARGLALTGRVWLGGDHQPGPGVVVLDADGRIARLDLSDVARDRAEFPERPAGVDRRAESGRPSGFDGPGNLDLPADLEILAVPWIGPGLLDTHVCPITVASSPVFHASGVAVVRGVGGADGAARLAAPDVAVTDVPLAADADPGVEIGRLARDGVTVIRIDLTAGRGLVAAAVRAAHDAGIAVTADAGTAAMVGRALDAEVDELLRLPHERLSEALVERLADAGTGVSSTLQAFFSDGRGREAAQNAIDLVRAGVPLRYGTCVGRARLGVDPRELDRLADTGLGRLGALRAATDVAAGAAGMPRDRAVLTVGAPADLVALAADPLVEPLAWHTPRLVMSGGRRVTG